MRVLLDENMHHQLRHDFGDEFEVETVQYRGWDSIRNGDLLELAEASFDAILTADQGIAHQQHLTDYDLAVVILVADSNRYADLAPLIDDACAALRDTRPGHATLVSS
jgi:predicted nuclease of predicted toxin-antitoxin system